VWPSRVLFQDLISKDSRATCYLQTLRPQLAVADFKKILAIEPKNETVRQQMVATQKLIRKIEFEKVR
jgi:serine/threonine-protein phosphatase 5